MRMQTGRYVTPTWKTGIAALVVQLVQCYLAYNLNIVGVILVPIVSIVCFVTFSEVLSIDELPEREDKSWLSRYTVYGNVGCLVTAAIQGISMVDILTEDSPMSIFYTSLVVLGVSVVLCMVSGRLHLPKTISNTTGWLMLGFVVIQTGVAYAGRNGSIIVPNEMMFVTYACWISGLLCWYVTGKRTAGWIGSLAINWAFAVGGGAIFEAMTRDIPEYHKFTWQFTLGVAVVMALYGTIDYLIFRPRRAKVRVEYHKLD
jgi:hypothetical protein